MQLFKSLFLATVAASTALAVSSGIEAGIKAHAGSSNLEGRRLERRGPIHDAISILENKKKVGSDFCSTFLHLPPYAATKTITTTKTLTKQVPLSTTTVKTVLTSTGTPVVVVGTTAVIVPVTPTVDITSVTAVPSTSTVSTITSVLTQFTTVATQVVTVTASGTATTVIPRNAPRPHDSSRTRLPYWLNQYSCPQVSKACSHVVKPRTTTVTKTASTTVTVKSGVVSVGQISTAVVTPTSTSITTVTSTSTAAAVTSTVVSASSSLIPVTATVDATTVISVTATATTTVTLPPPPPATAKARILLKKASDGTFFGYIGESSGPGYHNPVQSPDDAQIVSFPADFLVTGGPVNFAIENAYPNLGGIVGSGSSSNDLSSSSLNYVYILALLPVPANSQSTDTTGTAFSSAGYNAKYESQIWKLDVATNAVTIDWTNSDGRVFSSSTLFWDATVGYLGWTGNLGLFQNKFSGESVTGLTATLQLIT
ncbi:hypothetical protein OC842_004740 [Tilletia horrida]|uniref:Uncharacterized protein n=1 Tax=Tilletia horrida TaxID=155126 RepID=A0AAN6JQ02_9BASI|nr:hypothetical protein OC842_004740 [Tilletia horrida]KAK0567066.1 hypothetical protein OC844_000404 [Tilletia horrida]